MKVKYPFRAMGSSCEIVIRSQNQNSAKSIIEAAVKEVVRIEKKYSFFDPSSYLGAVNSNAADGWVEIDKETEFLFDAADQLWKSTGGRFDATVGPLAKIWDFRNMRIPHPLEIKQALESVGWDKIERNGNRCRFLASKVKIDFGGIAKEYAVDRCAEIIRMVSAESFLINLGGDIFTSVGASDDKPWSLGVSNPRDHKQAAGGFTVKNASVVTSGDYHRYFMANGVRYHHLLNPQTGMPLNLKYSGATFVSQATALETTMNLTRFYYSSENINAVPPDIDSFILFDNEGRISSSSKLPQDFKTY